ncbi:MAG: fimbrillin family protein [Rikenellaceae bacterium]
MKRYLIITTLAIVAMVGCNKEPDGDSAIAASFTSSITTRVSGVEWESGDQVGIMVTENRALLSGYHFNNLHDVTFTDPEQGIFTPATPLDQIYYSVDAATYIDFYAYYPYSVTLVEEDYNYPVSVAEQSTPKSLDFMEASTDGSGGYNKESGTVALNFTRNMAKISLYLKAGSNLSLSDISAVRLEGFYTTATYDFATGTFGSLGGESVDITPYDEGGNLYSVILIPESSASQMVYFTTPYGDVPLDLTSYTLSRGEHLYFTVTVSQTTATHSANSINTWDDADIDNNTFETE